MRKRLWMIGGLMVAGSVSAEVLLSEMLTTSPSRPAGSALGG